MLYYKLSNTGQVTIPKYVQKQLGFMEGDYLYIYQYQDSIAIVKYHQNTTLNQCVFQNRRISIPAELRRLLRLSIGTLLDIKISYNQDKMIIKRAKLDLLRDA